MRDRFDALERAAAAVGAQSIEDAPDRIAALQDELRETKRRLKAGGGGGHPQARRTRGERREVVPGVRLVAAPLPFDSMDALKASARDLRGVLGSGVIALGLDADEPQLFVTVCDDLVAPRRLGRRPGHAAMPSHRGPWRRPARDGPGRGTRREGLPDALAAIRRSASRPEA